MQLIAHGYMESTITCTSAQRTRSMSNQVTQLVPFGEYKGSRITIQFLGLAQELLLMHQDPPFILAAQENVHASMNLYNISNSFAT